jgi:hypothetical protein
LKEVHVETSKILQNDEMEYDEDEFEGYEVPKTKTTPKAPVKEEAGVYLL